MEFEAVVPELAGFVVDEAEGLGITLGAREVFAEDLEAGASNSFILMSFCKFNSFSTMFRFILFLSLASNSVI